MKYVNHFIAFVFICLSLYASAEVEKDGLTYEVIDGEYLKLISVSDKLKGELIIPDSVFVLDSNCNLPVQTIGKFSFNECDSIYAIVFPPTLESYESPLFLYCRGLKKVDMGNSKITIISGGHIGTKLEEIILPTKLEGIGDNAFSGLLMKYLKFPKSLQYITNSSFANSMLEEIDFDDAPLRLGNQVFYGCQNLKKVKWSSSMSSIGYRCFSNTSISEVILPKSFEEGYCSFSNLGTLKNVYNFNEEPNDIYAIMMFYNSDLSDCILWVPEGSEELYRNHEEWQGFKEVRGFDPAKIDDISVNSAQSESGTYDLMGRKIITPQPGQIYIDKGKKKLELLR